MAKGFAEFKKELSENEALRVEYEDHLKKFEDDRSDETDGHLIIAAAKKMGYDITIADLDRDIATFQELDLDEMELVSGGEDDKCKYISKTDFEDEHGHNSWCVTLWHCEMITCHTETDSKIVSCFKDYKCKDIYQNPES